MPRSPNTIAPAYIHTHQYTISSSSPPPLLTSKRRSPVSLSLVTAAVKPTPDEPRPTHHYQSINNIYNNIYTTTTILMMIINNRTTSGDCERGDIEHIAQYLRLGRGRVAHHQHLHVAWLPPRCQAHRSLTLMSPRMCVPLSRFFSHPPYASVPLMQWIVCWLSYQ